MNFKNIIKTKSEISTLVLFVLTGHFLFFAPQALAVNCSSISSYSDGTTVKTGEIVEHHGQIYECVVGGWCSIGGAYEPGLGWAWQHSWKNLGGCDPIAENDLPDDITPPMAEAAVPFPISKRQFNQLFPNRNQFYTYVSFVNAAKRFPRFAKTGKAAMRKREVAAALANFEHETGGFRYIREINRGVYCGNWGGSGCHCRPGKKYFGRGPIQLSWNGNYCAAGRALGLNLIEKPDMVARNPKVAWQTAIWFWMTQTGAGNMTAHQAIVNKRGFGETIRTINGALECNGGHPDQVTSRVQKFKRITKKLGVNPGGNLRC